MNVLYERQARVCLMLLWVVARCIEIGYADGAYLYARMSARYVDDLIAAGKTWQ